jgi:hypothetical protein
MTTVEEHPFRSYNDDELKSVPLSKLVHSNNRHEIMRRYTRALCLAVAYDSSFDQVDWIKAFLSTKMFHDRYVDSVDDFVKEAKQMQQSDLVKDVKHCMDYGMLKEARVTIVHDMLRAAAVDKFPTRQMETIHLVAKEFGLPETGVDKIMVVVQKEQKLLGESSNVLMSTAA